MKESESDTLRVHIKFKKRVMDFIEEYKKQNKLKISTTDATKLIDNKIEEAGGLIV